jgi:hypothetical protein
LIDISRLILLAISCLMLILLVTALVRSAATKADPRQLRVVAHPEGEQWLSIDQLAERLETRPAELLVLIERESIPFYVEARSSRADPVAYWFRRDEIDDWVVG